jgi:subtilisin-like proprotein convertase family protein
MKRYFWIALGLLPLLAAWLLWPAGDQRVAAKNSVAAPAPVATAVAAAPSGAKPLAVTPVVISRSAASTNREFFRLTNTPKTLGELANAPRAILLENALLDTTVNLNLNIPAHLRASANPGAYIVQARGRVDAPFRASLADAGAQIVSYIPNNAYLVQLSAAGAAMLTGRAEVAAVLPFAPYFKISSGSPVGGARQTADAAAGKISPAHQPTLLELAIGQKPLPAGIFLTLGLYENSAAATVAQIEKLGGKVLSQERSPFGKIIHVRPPAEWIALAQLAGVQRVEPAYLRATANDLARTTMGISTDTLTNANWLGLSGSNVLVEVNDTGIDATHPDFSVTGSAAAPGANPPTRVTGDTTNSLVDTDGHGTHVAGIIAGNGSMSINPVNVGANAQGSVTNADFRGKAPLANLYSFGFLGANDTNVYYSDQVLQETPALTNALISNNSWVKRGDNEYDLSAASYDAAVRDALPERTGPQPVLFVFAAGNDGYNNADDGSPNNDGVGGNSDTILSPGTAKNVVTVGALEQYRNITNWVTGLDGVSNRVWKAETSSGSQVAWYSARGNVGVQTEGDYGRFKPDVVAPGSFVVSTRSQQWDQAAYYNPTNYDYEYSEYGLQVQTNQLAYGGANVPINAVAVIVTIRPNALSPTPFPNLPLCLSSFSSSPDPSNPTTYDILATNNTIAIPPQSGNTISDITSLQNGGFTCAIACTNTTPVNFDLVIEIITTNDLGNQLTVLSNLNNTLGPYYRYETGTSMAAPAVSGALALMQDFFTNRLQTTPSPALLKAMVINGARLTTGYNFYGVTNNINYEGWGLVNVPNSVPLALTNTAGGASNTVPMYFLDQSPTNVLATGDSQTYNVTAPTVYARNQMLRVTLAWTDPPGNPVASIKLVNNLDLVVTNLDTGEVFYGNNFVSGQTPHSVAVNSNTVPDSINNVENVFLQTPLGTNYAVAVIGRNVTVNAVTAEPQKIVQDYALVISCGDGSNTNGITVTPATTGILPSTMPLVTITSPTNQIYYNQIAGANAPWLSTNAILFATNSLFVANAGLYIGQTNQWHFFVVTNTTTYTNAAFIIFLPDTLSLPREGVFADSTANSTRPEADLNLFVAAEGSLTNLDPAVIANCVYGTNGDQASLARGGTKFIAYSNSLPGEVYYVGVQCEDQTAGQFGFVPIFSLNPFSQTDTNGNEIVNGLLLPANIPDGTNPHPGLGSVFGLATIPMTVGGLTVTNTINTQNYGDLIGILTQGATFATLNNHNTPVTVTPPVANSYTAAYNDDNQPGTTHTTGPGSLRNFRGNQAIGPWILSEVDDSGGLTSSVTAFTLSIQPHKDLTKGFQRVTIQPGSWYYDYVDVAVGYTNMTVIATNLPPDSTPPLQLYLNYNVEPDFTNYLAFALLTNGVPPGPLGNIISYGPPLAPGRYYVGLFNPDVVAHTVLLGVNLAFNAAAITTLGFPSTGIVPLNDDAVTYDSVFVNNTNPIQNFNVGLRVDHQRISDLVFHLISPDGTRYLLMENRGGQTTNGCGATLVTTNITPVSSSGGAAATTNFVDVGRSSGPVTVSWNFFTVPDTMDIYYEGALIFSSGLVSFSGTTNLNFGPGVSTQLEVVMNATNHPTKTYWTYTIGGVQTNYYYLSFTEDTNLTTTPIKYAAPPFVPQTTFSPAMTDSFEAYPLQPYAQGAMFGGWTVATNQVEIVTNPPGYDGFNFLQLDNGVVFTNVPTVPGQKYVLTYALGSSLTDGSGPATNANWQAQSYVFTAAAASTPLVIAASSNALAGLTFTNAQTLVFSTNALLDDFILTAAAGNLNYQPEQDLSPLTGTSPYGLWQLEVLDNRAGATNNANLVSWDLGFTFANTNFTIPTITITNAGPQTNYIPGHSLAWYLISVPTNADFATNFLSVISGPTLNLWFSTNAPPTITNTPGDVQLLSVSGTGIAVLGTNGSPVNLTSAYIIPGGSYYLGVQNTNNAGANYAVNVTFHYLPSAPLVLTLPATGVLDTSATLNAAVVPDGLNTTVYFEYGLDTNYGAFSASAVLTNNLSSTNFVATGVTNLLPGAIYHFQAIGTNGLGTNYGGDLTFTNFADAPTVITEPATNILATTATLEAFLNPNGAPTALYFEYGLATNSLTNFSTTLSFTNNLNATNYFGIGVTNLTPGSVYYFQAIATNNTGTNYGGILTFTNLLAGPPPFAFTAPATLANGASAQLNGFATPNGSSATAWFEWGTSVGYGVTTPPVAVGTNYGVVFVTNQISGLTKNLPYHFRLVVSNAVGVTRGFDQIFDQANVIAWGADFFGQTLPLPTSLTNLVVGLGAGYDFSLAVNNDGTVVVWGDNTFGQTNVPAGLNNAVAVSGGEKDSLALRSDRTVLVWGSNQFHQTNVPPTLTNAVAASSGGYHCLALRADGNPVAWGFNSSGQTNIPAGLSNIVAVAGGDLHSLALKNDGTVVAWGFNDDGETNVPVGLTNVVAIAAGEYHNLALKSDGTVVAWGDNSGGQTNSSGLTNVIAIAAGGFHSLALKSDGTVVQWGDNTAGQLNSYPTNLNNVVSIAGGGFHSLALSSIYGLNQTNTAPFWTNGLAGSTLTMNELTTLLVTNTATDTNFPAQILTYTLLTNAPAWASINAQGVITFLPQEADGPSTNTISTVVTDNGRPVLSATNSFTLIVNEVNLPPIFFYPTNTTVTNIFELIPFAVSCVATDLDIPVNPLTFALVSGPAGLMVTTNGLINWTPTEAQGPGTYTVQVSVTDANVYALTNQSYSVTNSFTINVLESNSPPFWTNSFPTVTMNELTTNTVNAAAQDADIPTNTLTYALTNSPAWAVINTNSGLITLTPLEADGPSTNTVTVIVTDNGSPQLSATTNFTVIVNEVNLAPYWPTNVPSQTNYVIGVSNLLTVTNTATDSDIPTNLLTYTNWVSPAANPPAISTNGIITWTPQSVGTFVISNVVTDYNPWALTNQKLSATNYFTVTVTNAPTPPTNAIAIASIVATNGGFLLTWFAPSNDLFQVQVTTNLAPANWLAFTNPAAVGYNTNFPASATNAQFNFFDDGSQVPFGALRFYRLLLLQNTNTLSFPAPSNQVVSVSATFTVTNTATDSDTNAVLTYSLLNAPAGASINTNSGVITWPNAMPAGLAARFTTVVTDNSLPPLTASNLFTVFVTPFPAITNVTVTATNVVLQWFAPTNDVFEVQWTTNLAPPNWLIFTNAGGNLMISSGTGAFTFTDTNAPALMKFYELILLP